MGVEQDLRRIHLQPSLFQKESLLPLPGQICLGIIPVRSWYGESRQLENLLTPPERQRVQRFCFSKDQLCFLITRALLRRVLGQLLFLPPKEVPLQLSLKGKPELARGVDNGWAFNLSHSGEYAVLAWGRGCLLGVDVEVMSGDYGTLVSCFHPQEQICIRRLSSEQQKKRFWQLWTGKEAFVKGMGVGLYRPLNSFWLQPAEGGGYGVHTAGGQKSAWKIVPFEVSAGYAGALALLAKAAGTCFFSENEL